MASPAQGGCAIPTFSPQAGPTLVAQAEDPFPSAKMVLICFAYLRLVELQQDRARGEAAVVEDHVGQDGQLLLRVPLGLSLRLGRLQRGVSHNPDGVRGTHSPAPPTAHPTPLGMETLLLATIGTHLHRMPTERSLLYRFRPLHGGPALSRWGCSAGKGDTKKGDTRPYHPVHTYLAQDIHGQVHQPKNVPLVPRVQHADVVGDVVGAALHPSQGGLLKPDTAGSPRGPPCSSPIAWGWWRSPQHSPCLACWWDKQSAGETTSPVVSRTPTACAEARSCRSPGDGGGCVSGAVGARQLLLTGM